MQQSFWTSWLLLLQSLGPAAAPVLGPRLWRQLSYLSMTFDAGRPRYTSLPQLTQNRMLLTTSKLSSEVEKIFLIWEFYLWNYCRARGRHLSIYVPLLLMQTNIKNIAELSSVCRNRFFKFSLTFLQGFEDTSKEALKARLCWVVRMVRGLLGLLGSFPSSPFPWPPMLFSGLMSNSSSSLFSAERVIFLYHQHKLELTTPF